MHTLPMCMLAMLAFVACVPAALSQGNHPGASTGDAPAGPNDSQQVLQQFNEILQAVGKKEGMHWDREAAALAVAIERFYQIQGWTTESDRFACKFDIEVMRIPPWKPQERFDKAVEMFRDRYRLTDPQAARLQQMLVWILLEVGTRHASNLIAYGKDVLANGGISGAESDAEKVARWVKLLQPALEDAMAALDKQLPDFLATLDAEQREIVQRDFAANDRRAVDGRKLLAKWAAGQWRLEDSGLTREMFDSEWITRQLERQKLPGGDDARLSPAAAALQRTDPGKPDAWTLYVQAFVRKYSLDASQRDTAYGVLKELRGRAAEYFISHRTDLQDLTRRAEKASEEVRAAVERERETLTQPIALMFQELKDRLEMLPTEQQRAAAAVAAASQASRPAGTTQAPGAGSQPADASLPVRSTR